MKPMSKLFAIIKIPEEELVPNIFSKYGEVRIDLSINEILSKAE